MVDLLISCNNKKVQRPKTCKVSINPMSKRNMIISITQLYSNSLYFSVFADDFEIYRCILHDIAATVLLFIYIDISYYYELLSDQITIMIAIMNCYIYIYTHCIENNNVTLLILSCH